MIPKIPILAGQVFDVRSHGHEPPSRLQAAPDFIERPAQCRLVGQVLEKIAGEDDIERTIGERPAGRAVLQQKLHVRAEVPRRVRVQIHRIFFTGADGVAEFAIAAAEIENRLFFANKPLKPIAAEHLPHALAILDAGGKTRVVDTLEIGGVVGGAHGFR